MIRSLAPLVLVLIVVGAAVGQPIGTTPTGNPPAGPPTFTSRSPTPSPYLNLLGGAGGIPAVNYSLGVRPFLQRPVSPFATQPGAFPQQAGYLPPPTAPAREYPTALEPTDASSLPPTGHPVTFGNRNGPSGSRSGFFPPSGSQQQPAGAAKAIPRAKK